VTLDELVREQQPGDVGELNSSDALARDDQCTWNKGSGQSTRANLRQNSITEYTCEKPTVTSRARGTSAGSLVQFTTGRRRLRKSWRQQLVKSNY
jgi:hypothetical protein